MSIINSLWIRKHKKTVSIKSAFCVWMPTVLEKYVDPKIAFYVEIKS